MGDNVTLDCCLDLMRRLPPQNIEKNLSAIVDLTPQDMLQDLLSAVDQPLKIAICSATKRQYLVCDYNRDGDSYRSPWSNTYDPPLDDGTVPTEALRKLEIRCNAAFEQYREMYFEGGISSCYIWDIDEKTFAGVLLIKKAGEGSDKIKGCWDSIHVFEIISSKKEAKYKLTSTVMLWLQVGSMFQYRPTNCLVNYNWVEV
uniref:F-actin-capping protein subunit beta n=1 Tax=Henneguya salminicola TaxID=69463 RepID=A0A6G3MGN3_HENSL